MWFWVITSCIALFFLAWLGVSIYLRIKAPGRIFETDKSNIKIHIKHQKSFLKNSAGEKIEVVTIPNKHKRGVVLYFHGSVGRLTNVLTGLREFGTVISPAFPGYAGSEGRPSTRKIYETVDVVMKDLSEKGYKQRDITIVGHSMGGVPAIYAAAKYPHLKKVVLVNVFYSLMKLCNQDHYGFCLLTFDFLNNGLLADKTRAKIRQFHVRTDKTVPFADGKLLFEKLGSKDKKFFEHGETHRFFNVRNVLTKE